MPPVPLTAPRLLAKQSRQLVVSPLVSYSGDGPITSIRLHYRPQDSTMAWSAIVGEWGELGRDRVLDNNEGRRRGRESGIRGTEG